MKMKYSISIGDINGQNHYTIITANGKKRAKELALKKHIKLGRRTENVNVYIDFIRPYQEGNQ